MLVNLIKSDQMFSLTLPNKVKGQYWVTDLDKNGKTRELISVEANGDDWVLKSNKKVNILDGEGKAVKNTLLYSQCFFDLEYKESEEKVCLYVEKLDSNRQTFTKYIIKDANTFTIGRTENNDICYPNGFVSSKHAQLSFDGEGWTINDKGSSNGTYVNGYRVHHKSLEPGDLIYIMGLQIIIIGKNVIAINNPQSLMKINSNNIFRYKRQAIQEREFNDIPEKDYFFRSPRFYKEISEEEISIDPPPQIEKNDNTPMILMLGPSLTMGITSISTGALSLTTIMNNGGNITQALPTLIMSLSMVCGTVLWPLLTKKYEKKNKIKNELERQEKYHNYLNEIRDDIKKITLEQEEILRTNLVSLEECSSRIAERKINLWERAIDHNDFLKLRVGLGNLPLNAIVKFPEKKFSMQDDTLKKEMLKLGEEEKLLKNVPISISLFENNKLGVYGKIDKTINMMKSLILQMISLHSYDELKLVLICDETNEDDKEILQKIRYVPHFFNDDKTTRYIATNINEVRELSVLLEQEILSRQENSSRNYSNFKKHFVIISTSKALAEKCESLNKLLAIKENIGFSIINISKELKDLPKETEVLLEMKDNSRLIYSQDVTKEQITFKEDVISNEVYNNVFFDIANIELDLTKQSYILPTMLTFLEMFDVSKIEHLNSLTRWKENNPTTSLKTPIGVDEFGESFYLDLHEKFHGPHGLVAGMTGSGKSEFIITYILSLAVNYHPDEVSFVLIDYKGGGLAGAFVDEERGIKLPHLAGTITNLDGALVNRSLISIQSELRRRQAIFNEAKKVSHDGTMDIYKYQKLYREKVVNEPVPHLFIISDEFAELKTQQPEFMQQLISAARIGRSLGVHLILATQKPSGVVDDQIWSNSKFRVCLKVQEKQDSHEMIKCDDAAQISQTGRFYLQVGFNELFALGQSAWCGADYIPTDTVEKRQDTSIQVIDNLGRVSLNSVLRKKSNYIGVKEKQIVTIVKYLSDLSNEEEISVKQLWLDPIPSHIYLEDLENKYSYKKDNYILNPVIGEYDDPFNQKQDLLTIPYTEEGNSIIYGATGNGKTTMLTTVCYSLIKNHTPDELNIYIADFGSETLKVFENAPHVGDVVLSSEKEKLINLLKMLSKEIENRKMLFSEYGGDYQSFIKYSDDKLPNIVVMLNNYAGFKEQYDELSEMLHILTRDGVRYGIYFTITANDPTVVPFRSRSNFKVVMTMQLNDVTDYQTIVGKTEGLIPSKCKGRGLISLGKVFEFQTAYCKNVKDHLEFIRTYCKDISKKYVKQARPIPVLPEIVNYEYVKNSINDLKTIPIGVNKKSLEVITCNLSNKVAYPVLTQNLEDANNFIEEFVNVISCINKTYVIDCGHIFDSLEKAYLIKDDFNASIVELFKEMVTRNNTYKDNQRDLSSLDAFDERVYVIIGMKKLYDLLDSDTKDKLNALLTKAESYYKIHFVIIESYNDLTVYNYDTWFKHQVNGYDGIWIGDGFKNQSLFNNRKQLSTIEEVESQFGYVLQKNKAVLAKLLSSKMEED